jgi:cell division protein FtsQ
VDRVAVTGLTTTDAPRVRRALVATARGMTTLHVSRGELELAVSGYPVVQSLRIQPDFPHGLRIHVVERRPVAVLGGAGGRLPVAGDGTILRGIAVDGPLPVLRVQSPPAGTRVTDPRALAPLRLVAAAPAALLPRVERAVRSGPRGWVVEVRRGPELIFGDLSALRAKWQAAARVLADPSSKGAAYVDVRLPERPVAGGPGLQADTSEAPDTAGASQAPPPATAPQADPGLARAPAQDQAPGGAPPAAVPPAQPPASAPPTAPPSGVQSNPQP